MSAWKDNDQGFRFEVPTPHGNITVMGPAMLTGGEAIQALRIIDGVLPEIVLDSDMTDDVCEPEPRA